MAPSTPVASLATFCVLPERPGHPFCSSFTFPALALRLSPLPILQPCGFGLSIVHVLLHTLPTSCCSPLDLLPSCLVCSSGRASLPAAYPGCPFFAAVAPHLPTPVGCPSFVTALGSLVCSRLPVCILGCHPLLPVARLPRSAPRSHLLPGSFACCVCPSRSRLPGPVLFTRSKRPPIQQGHASHVAASVFHIRSSSGCPLLVGFSVARSTSLAWFPRPAPHVLSIRCIKPASAPVTAHSVWAKDPHIACKPQCKSASPRLCSPSPLQDVESTYAGLPHPTAAPPMPF